MDKTFAGICLGSSAIKFVRMQDSLDGFRILESEILPHDGDPLGVAAESIVRARACDYAAVTGGKFRDLIDGPAIPEAHAMEQAVRYATGLPGMPSLPLTLLSLGAESFVAYGIDESGSVVSVESRNKCASGTGGFLAQQIRRMGLDFQQA